MLLEWSRSDEYPFPGAGVGRAERHPVRVDKMKHATVLVATVLTSVLSACGEEAARSEPRVEVAWISKGQCNSFFDISRFGARLASHDLAQEDGKNIHVEMLEPDDCTPREAAAPTPAPDPCAVAAPQRVAIEQAIAQRAQAIAISVANPSCITPLLDEAVDAGIKVITFDSDAPQSKRQVYYGMDNRSAARLAVRALASLIGESGKVAIQTSMIKDAEGTYQLSSSSSYVERMAGVHEELANHPQMTLVATVPCTGSEVTEDTCAKAVEEVLTEHSDLAGFIFARGKVLRELDLDMKAPVFTARVLADSLHAVALDAPDDALGNIKAGYAELAIAQKQFGWGYDVVKLAYDMVVNGWEGDSFFDSGWYSVCPSNVDQYAAMWQEQDFRQALAACPLSE